jgi:hypothetical protein
VVGKAGFARPQRPNCTELLNRLQPQAYAATSAVPGIGSRSDAGWFGALDGLDLLTQPERSAARQFGEFLRAIERESITKSYKLVTLQAVVELGGLSSRVSVASLAARSREIMRGDPRLAADVAEHLGDPDCRLPVPWDHPRCQKHGTTSRPQRPAGVMIPAVGQIVKCAVAGVSPV